MLKRVVFSPLWQLGFILFGTSWLWAPILNHNLSSRTALISQYEIPGQPYAWLFKSFDVLAALLLLLVVNKYRRQPSRFQWYLLLIIGLGLLTDPLFSTSCRIEGQVCHEYFSLGFLLHAIETTLTASALFLLAVADYWRRKRLLSAGFIIFQVVYGLLFVSQLASQDHFNTASQYVYQVALIGWLAWYVRDMFLPKPKSISPKRSLIRVAAAGLAFGNGLAAILISLAHLRLLGHLSGLYFASDGAWLAQHTIITGLVLLYLSRHLYRGEHRARQIFVLLMAIETIKYSVISPHPVLLAFYMANMLALFVLKDDFDRGTEELTWNIRLRDLTYLAGTVSLVILISIILLYRSNELSDITTTSIDRFFDYTLRSKVVGKSYLQSALLAHALSTFILTIFVLALWIIFRPARPFKAKTSRHTYVRVQKLLNKYSDSSEDFFKLWPQDKQYLETAQGMIAYKTSGSIALALADPIAKNKTTRKQLLADYIRFCRNKGWRACFLPIAEGSRKIYQSAGFNLIQIGASALIDINEFLDKTARDKWWRWKKNKALREGFDYMAANPPHSEVFLRELRLVSDAWLSRPGHQERGFALGYFDEQYLQQCTVHYLKDKSGKIVAFANQLPLLKDMSQTTVDLIRYLPKTDAMPYLLYKTIEDLQSAGFSKFDLGFVPFAATDDVVIKIVRTLSGGRFSARGLEQFKNKFDPEWIPMYIAYDGDVADLALVALSVESILAVD